MSIPERRAKRRVTVVQKISKAEVLAKFDWIAWIATSGNGRSTPEVKLE